MRALEYAPTLPAYALSRFTGGTRGGPLTLLRLAHRAPAPLRADGWTRLRPVLTGICGSDVAAVTGRASTYLGALASTPFVPGHEVVGVIDEATGSWRSGQRVVVEPLLSCTVRGISPPCPRCAAGEPQGCESVTEQPLGHGLQSGYCAATGGGWATEMAAHHSQLHPVPDSLDDRDAVLVEPLACAIHAVLRNRPVPGSRVLVVGAGTLGLLTLAVLRELMRTGRLIATAKHPIQSAHARRLGADVVCTPEAAVRTVRFETRARQVTGRGGEPFLLGGVDTTFECSGTAPGLRDAMAATRAGGTVVMLGMPGRLSVDLAPAWQRELRLVGTYAYGVERTEDGASRSTFELAIEAAARLRLGSLVADPWPLESYAAAVAEAASAGSRGVVKVAFSPQSATSAGARR